MVLIHERVTVLVFTVTEKLREISLRAT